MATCRGRELPKYDMALARLYSAARDADGDVARWRAMHAALAKTYDADWLADELGGRRADDVDVTELEALYTETATAYGSAAREASGRSLAEVTALLEQIPVDRIRAIGEAVDMIYEQPRRQGFRRVV